MNRDPIHSRPFLKSRRNQLRRHLTPAEAALWRLLKHKQFQGRKFRRQHSINNYIVDFYCAGEMLIIELDGQPHQNPGTRIADEVRDNTLTALGYTVLRFENHLVFEDPEGVLETIKAHFKA